MKLATKELKKILAACASVTPTRSPDDRLLYAKIEGGAITATDSETFLTYKIDAIAEEPLLLNVATLRQICGTTSCDEIEIKNSNNGVSIKAGKSKFNLGTLDSARFPKAPPTSGYAVAVVDGEELKEAIEVTLPNVDEISTKSGLTGICFSMGPWGFRILSADNNGATAYWIHRDPVEEVQESITTKCAKALLSICEGKVSISRYAGGLVFSTDRSTLISPCLVGKFPIKTFLCGYDLMFKDSSSSTFERQLLLEGLSQVGIVLAETNGIHVEVDGSLKILSRQDGSTVTVDVEAISSGNPWKSQYQHRYLTRAVKAMDEKLSIRTADMKQYKALEMSSGRKVAIVMSMTGVPEA